MEVTAVSRHIINATKGIDCGLSSYFFNRRHGDGSVLHRVLPGTRPPRIALCCPPGSSLFIYDIDVIADAQKMTFSGSAGIDIEVSKATRSITLNAMD